MIEEKHKTMKQEQDPNQPILKNSEPDMQYFKIRKLRDKRVMTSMNSQFVTTISKSSQGSPRKLQSLQQKNHINIPSNSVIIKEVENVRYSDKQTKLPMLLAQNRSNLRETVKIQWKKSEIKQNLEIQESIQQINPDYSNLSKKILPNIKLPYIQSIPQGSFKKNLLTISQQFLVDQQKSVDQHQSNKVEHTRNKFELVNILKGHEFKSSHRSRMIDWMLTVLTAFNKSSDRTHFIAVGILDQVFVAKQLDKTKLEKRDLHLYGLTAIFIASKLEDSLPIRIQQIVKDAAHNKFTKQEILETEQDILRCLNFKLNQETVYDVAMEKLEVLFIQNQPSYFTANINLDEIRDLLKLMIHLSIMKVSFNSIPKEIVANSCISITLRLISGLYSRSQLSISSDFSSQISTYQKIAQKFENQHKVVEIQSDLIFPKMEKLCKKAFSGSLEFKALLKRCSQIRLMQIFQQVASQTK